MSRYCSVIGCKSDDTYKNIKYFFDYICVKVTTYFFNMHDDIVKELDEHGVNLTKKNLLMLYLHTIETPCSSTKPKIEKKQK